MTRRAIRVLVHVDERRRDVPVLFALRHLFEAAGCRVLLSSRWTTASYLRHLPFDAVIVPSLTYLPYEALPRLAARTKLYMLPTEGALFEEWPLLVKYGGGVDPARWPRQIQATTRFFLWGESSHRVLRATGRFRDDQLLVIGAPRMDFFLVGPSSSAAHGDPGAMGIISNFYLTNSYHRLHIFQAVDQGRHGGEGFSYAAGRGLEDRFWIESAEARVWVELFDACRARGERLSVRIHPREDLAGYRYLQDKYADVLRFDGQGLTFESWLDRIGILLGYNSTTFFEAVASGKPAVNLMALVGERLEEHIGKMTMGRYPIMEHLEAPTSLEELFALIQQMREGRWARERGYSPACRALLRDVCQYPREQSALAMVVRTVVEDLGGPLRPEGWRSRWASAARYWHIRAREAAAFAIRRTPITSPRFPMRLRRFERDHAEEIARYLRAAATFPVGCDRGTIPAPPALAVAGVGG